MAHLAPKSHPLERNSEFRFIEFDNRFGGTAVYKARTAVVNPMMHSMYATRVEGTEVRVIAMYDLYPRHSMIGLTGIAWVRRHKIEDIKHAVAWCLMQDKVPVIVRAFIP